MSRLLGEKSKNIVIAFAFFLINALCEFGHRKLPINISQKLLKLVASDLFSWRSKVNRLPGEQDGGQANGWGIVFYKHNISFFILSILQYHR